MVTLQQAMSHAIERVEGGPPQTADGQWPIHGQVIYGAGGWNRYFIRDNEVTFSSHHATEEATENARTVGFTIE
jgi:hypothetical protein